MVDRASSHPQILAQRGLLCAHTVRDTGRNMLAPPVPGHPAPKRRTAPASVPIPSAGSAPRACRPGARDSSTARSRVSAREPAQWRADPLMRAWAWLPRLTGAGPHALERDHTRAGVFARAHARWCVCWVWFCVCRSLGVVFAVWDSGAARNRWVPGRLPEVCCGGVLLSHNLSVAVPLALPGLASRFGMLLGVSPVL